MRQKVRNIIHFLPSFFDNSLDQMHIHIIDTPTVQPNITPAINMISSVVILSLPPQTPKEQDLLND